jgi:hypothetical protein
VLGSCETLGREKKEMKPNRRAAGAEPREATMEQANRLEFFEL